MSPRAPQYNATRMSIYVVTAYHFPKSDAVPWARLLRSVRASLAELADRGMLILVPSGPSAAPAKEILDELGSGERKRVEPTSPTSVSSNVVSLNAGVNGALRLAGDSDSWIAAVQSSVVVKPGWLNAMLKEATQHKVADAIFGRLVSETDDRRIWADGHYLDQGRTWNVHHDGAPCRLPRHPFPCLSAALFSRRLIKDVCVRYGNFVCENLMHLGDCTDVALRAVEVGRSAFVFSEQAVATKRWPTIDPHKASVSQVLAATRYYSNRTQDALERIRKKYDDAWTQRAFEDAERLQKPDYSPIVLAAPRATIDESDAWRSSAKSRT